MPRAGLRHSALAACLLLLLAIDAGQRDADERSLRATNGRGEKASENRCLKKSRALGPPQAMKKRTFQLPQAKKILPLLSAKMP